jgi:hypothetical protein
MKKLLVTGGNGLVGSSINADIKIGRQYDLKLTDETNKMFDHFHAVSLDHFLLYSY